MAGLVLALLGALLLLPSSGLQRFDGLPLGTLPEFVGLALLVPLLASRALRRLHRRALTRADPRLGRALLAAGALALVLKLLLLGAGVREGFLACYRSPLGPPSAGPCERSWENPFFRFGATRLDRSLDFAPETWNLSFLNSLRFDFWLPGQVRRDRLPLEATWQGEVEGREPWVLRVTYAGRAAVAVGPVAADLPPRYDGLGAARLEVPAGRHPVTVRYRFDDGSRIQGPPAPGPYAILRLAREGPAGEVPLRAARPAPGWRVAAWLADGLTGILLGWVVVVLAGVVRPAWPALVPTVVVGVIGILVPVLPRLAGRRSVLAAEAVLLVLLLASNRPRTRLALFFATLGLTGALAARRLGAGHVVLRSAGDDWLIYESFARTILETGSLRGGEDVFYNQPLFRYVLAGIRFLLGDGELPFLAAGLAGLAFGVLWAVGRLAGRRRPPARTAACLGVGLLLLALVNSAPVVWHVLAPLSEPVTWMALLALFPLLVASRSAPAWAVGGALAGLSIATRPNQAPGLLLLMGAFLATALPRRPRPALVAAGLCLAAALLPLAHNLYYGGRWVAFATAGAAPANVLAPPSRWLAALHDAGSRAIAWEQLRHVLFWLRSLDPVLDLAAHGLQLAWLAAIVTVACRRVRVPATSAALLALPAAYLAVHLVYNAHSYFPRHEVAGYLAMGLVALSVGASSSARQPDS